MCKSSQYHLPQAPNYQNVMESFSSWTQYRLSSIMDAFGDWMRSYLVDRLTFDLSLIRKHIGLKQT
jgi:hypothetical protein